MLHESKFRGLSMRINKSLLVFLLLTTLQLQICTEARKTEEGECRNPNYQRPLSTTDRCYANVTSVDFWSDLLESVRSNLYVSEISENLETIEQHILTDLYESVRHILPETFRERSDLVRHLRERTAESRRKRESEEDSLLDSIARHFHVGFHHLLHKSEQTDLQNTQAGADSADDKRSGSSNRITNNCAARLASSPMRHTPIGELIYINDVTEMWTRNTKLQEQRSRTSFAMMDGSTNDTEEEAKSSDVETAEQHLQNPANVNKELATALTVCYATIFYLSQCPFSRELLVTLELVARRYVPPIPIFAIDAERSARHWNTKFGVVCVPTLFVFEERRAVAKYNLSSYKLDDVVEWFSAVLGTKINYNMPDSTATGNEDDAAKLLVGNFDPANELHAIERRLSDSFGQVAAISAADSTLCLAWFTMLFVALVSFLRSTYGTIVLRRASVVFVKLQVSVRELLKGR